MNMQQILMLFTVTYVFFAIFTAIIVSYLIYVNLLQKTCEHHWYKIGENKIAIENNSWKYYAVIYCPTCRKKKNVPLSKWFEIEEQQKIDMEVL